MNEHRIEGVAIVRLGVVVVVAFCIGEVCDSLLPGGEVLRPLLPARSAPAALRMHPAAQLRVRMQLIAVFLSFFSPRIGEERTIISLSRSSSFALRW